MKKLLILLFIFIGCQRTPVYKTDRNIPVTFQQVDVGTTANDHHGDPLRTAFIKQNDNWNTADALFGTIYSETETKDVINDSLNARVAAAHNATTYFNTKADTNTYKKPMTYNGVVNYVAAHGGSGSGGFSGYKFIVGTTTGSPANTDTTHAFASLAGQHIEVYRGTDGDMTMQYYNTTATNGKPGYRYNSSGTVVVRPAWATGDMAIIKGYPSSSVTWYALAGGGSGLPAKLRAGWQLDEPAGTSVADVLGVYGGTTSAFVNTPLKYGVAESFSSASSQSINLGTTVGDVGTSDFTLAGWIYLSTYPSAYNTSGMAGNWGTYPYFYAGVYGDHKFKVDINFAGTDLEFFSDAAISLSTLYHVAVVFDRSGTATLYIDGVAQADTEDISGGVAVNITNANTFSIGCIGSALAGHYWNGLIDDVYLFDEALSSGEVTELMANTYPW